MMDFLTTNKTAEMNITNPENYPGYPTQRLILDTTGVDMQGMEIPDGGWTMNALPLPTPQESLNFTQKGYTTDSLGRPLHPWADLLLSSETGGTVTGKGAYWHWGPNATADPIVITTEERPRVLLIKRSDTGAMALPGGFLDGDEDPYVAALRELKEETGLADVSDGRLIYQGPVADLRTTIHAWAETNAYLFTIDEPKEVHGDDDALAADWWYLDELSDKLFGSHANLIKLALDTRN